MNNYWVQDVLKSRNICNDDFIERFFSDANITRIQQTLIQKVKQEGYSITRQSEEQVYLLMKYFYNAYAYGCGQERNIDRLNNLVLDKLVPMVLSNIREYMRYSSEIDKVPLPMAYGAATSVKGLNNNHEMPYGL